MNNLGQIAQLLRNTGSRLIIVDQGEPVGVLLSLEDYENLTKPIKNLAEDSTAEKVNLEVEKIKNQEEREEDSFLSDPEEEKIEDGKEEEEEEIYFEEVDPFTSKEKNEVISF